jgi:hypothetical protein
MRGQPRRRKGAGSLGQLKARLWAEIEYATSLVENGTTDHELRLQGLTALVQAALAYAKILDLYEKEREIERLEALAAQVTRMHNGHRA